MDKTNPFCASSCRLKNTWSQICRMLSWHAQKLIKLEHLWLSYLDLALLPGLTTGETHYYTISSQLVSIVQLSLRISCNITQLSLSQTARCRSLSPQCPTLPPEPSDGPHLFLHSPQPLFLPRTCYTSIILSSLNSEEWRMIPFWPFSCVQRIIHISAKPTCTLPSPTMLKL